MNDETIPGAGDDGSETAGARPHRALPSGTRIGRYEILGVLDGGGMGFVYRARDPALDRVIALKCPLPWAAVEPRTVQRFLREARTAANLSHPHIVPIHEVFDVDGVPWIAMQLIQGTDLRRRLEAQGPPPMANVMRWAEELAGALEAAHSARVLHRDLKPGNVLIDGDDRVFLADFGLARREPGTGRDNADGTTSLELTRPGAIVGTPAYMSPEQALGRPLDARSDIYSLGAVFYEMCTGQRLMSTPAGTPSSRSSLEVRSIRRHNPAVPVGLERIIRKAADPVIENRYVDAGTLVEDLRRCRRAWEARRLDRAGPWKWLAAVIVLGAAIVAGVIAIGRGSLPAGNPRAGELFGAALVTWPSRDTRARVAPDGRWVSFASNREGQQRIWLHNRTGNISQPVTPEGVAVIQHVWSPDGVEIAYLTPRGSDWLLQIVPALGGPPERSFVLGDDAQPGWMIRWLDGGIYLTTEQGSLILLDPQTGAATVLIASGPWNRSDAIDVRGDEARLVYAEGSGKRFSLWTSDLDGGDRRRLTSGDHSDAAPVWIGRAGERVAFTSNRAGQPDLWLVDTAGGSTERVTLSAEPERVTDATPDGSLIVFQRTLDAVHLWIHDAEQGSHRQLTTETLSDYWPSVARDAPVVAFQRAKPRLDDVASLLGTRILVGRVEQRKMRDPRPVVESGYAAHLSDDGRWLASLRGGTELWLHEVATGHESLVTRTPKHPGYSLHPLGWDETNVAWTEDAMFYAERDPWGGRLLRIDLEPRGARAVPLVEAEGVSLRDLAASADGTRLAYLHDTPGAVELRVRNLDTGEERSAMTDSATLYCRGWLADGASLLLLRVAEPDAGAIPIELLRVGPGRQRRQVARVERGFVAGSELDADSNTLFLTTEVGGGVHALVGVSLETGEQRVISRDDRPGVSYSAMQRVGASTFIYAKEENNTDIWTLALNGGGS